MCHICDQHDPRLAPLMLNVRCESQACQHSHLGRQCGPFWHVIHHWFHLAATAVSQSPSHRPLTPLRTHSRMIKYLSGIRDSHPNSMTEDNKKKPLSCRFYATLVSPFIPPPQKNQNIDCKELSESFTYRRHIQKVRGVK